jgi:hypothetical protein
MNTAVLQSTCTVDAGGCSGVIQLGSFDDDVTPADCEAYLRQTAAVSGLRGDLAAAGSDRLTLAAYVPESPQAMSVAGMQRALRTLGFFPGGRVDGICGYRTRSAMRLFQEYVRSVEKQPCVPDGRFGSATQKHLERWLSANQQSTWASTVASWQAGTLRETEYADWLALLAAVQRQYLDHPTDMIGKVNAFTGRTDTRRVSDWDLSPRAIHLVGIRRSEKTNKFDDLFVLLIKGLVFKFQGSTDPGATSHPLGAPFLVYGQHDYHFGWHKGQQLALRPTDRGVLVVRSKVDFRLDESDVKNGLEANPTIHIHWGGKGLTFNVNNWSEGCQVINGSAYIGPNDERIDCSSFVAVNNGEIAANPARTRGAYNVIADLVLGIGNDLPGDTIRYTLIAERDLALTNSVRIAGARAAADVLLA